MYNDSDYTLDRASRSQLAVCIVNVYWWMTFALLLSGGAAWAVGTSQKLTAILIKNSGINLALVLLTLGLVFWISLGINKMSASTATALFVAYSVLNGLMLSSIFLTFKLGTIAVAFGVTAGSFAAMALVGTFTKKDLTGLGNLFFMFLIGIVIATLVNMFLRNAMVDLVISYIGVLVFVGLTAYNAQKIKNIYMRIGTDDSELVRKAAVIGALTLYLDFINLFLFFLRIIGGRRD